MINFIIALLISLAIITLSMLLIRFIDKKFDEGFAKYMSKGAFAEHIKAGWTVWN